jgi:hypothetical protein
MTQSNRLSSATPPVAFGRPTCPECKAEMMLTSIEPARPGVDLHTFKCACAVCDHVLTAVTAYEDPMKSKALTMKKALGRWLQGDLRPPTQSARRRIAHKPKEAQRSYRSH